MNLPLLAIIDYYYIVIINDNIPACIISIITIMISIILMMVVNDNIQHYHINDDIIRTIMFTKFTSIINA